MTNSSSDCLWLILAQSFARLAGPAGMKMLLDYLERGYDPWDVRPWVWIAVTVIGPLTAKGLYQYYIYLSVRHISSRVRTSLMRPCSRRQAQHRVQKRLSRPSSLITPCAFVSRQTLPLPRPPDLPREEKM